MSTSTDVPEYVFVGDSITDADRDRSDPDSLGEGYVRGVAETLAAADRRVAVRNRGVSGDRIRDVRLRWDRDCLQKRPALVSVLIGINDTWRTFAAGDPTTAADFESDYTWLLTSLRDQVGCPVVLVEPFLLPVDEEQTRWRDDVDDRIAVVHGLAARFDAVVVPADAVLNAAVTSNGPAALARDGIHLTAEGHRLLAALWLASVDGAKQTG